MSGKQVALAFVLAGFLGLSAYAVLEHGYAGFFEQAMANWATRLMFADLCISLALITLWMYFDARRRRASFLPYALLTATFGAAGPLLYLMRREAGVASRAVETRG